jgi:hypothetical protein
VHLSVVLLAVADVDINTGRNVMYLGQDLLWEGLCDLEDIGLNAGLLKTSLLGLSNWRMLVD